MENRAVATNLFQLIFAGGISPGEDIEEVKNKLASILKFNEKQIAGLFSGKRTVVKRRADDQTAEKFRAAFQRAGAILEVKPLPMKEQSPPKKEIHSQNDESAARKPELHATPGSSTDPEPGSNVLDGGKSTGLFALLKKIFQRNKTGKKILCGIVGIILIFLFALVIDFALPVFIAMPIFVMPILALLVFIFDDKFRTLKQLINILRCIILGPLLVAGICAPVHAIFVTIHFRSPIIVDFCPWVLPWYDIGIGAAGTILGIFGGFIFVFQALRQSRQIENLPTSKARSAALGLAEFHGVARPVEDRNLFKEEVDNEKPFMKTWEGAPKDGIILFGKWWDSQQEDGTSKTSQEVWYRFYLEDDSGRILVDPNGVNIEAPGGGDVRSIILSKRHTSTSVSHENHKGNAWSLMPGDPVYLIGSVEINEDAPPDATGSDRLVVRPSSRLSQTNFLRRFILGSVKWLPGKEIRDIFLLSDTDEIGASTILRKGIKYTIILAILFTASSFWLFVYSATGFK